MALFHVNSTGANPAATPTAPYDTWAKAAASLADVDGAVSAAGDTVYVHPSHVDTNPGTVNFSNGTEASPIKIVCGTPDTVSGITALQTTAVVLSTTAAVQWGGNTYTYGVYFKMTGSNGSAAITLNGLISCAQTYEQCELSNQATATVNIVVGLTGGGNSTTTFNNCRLRCGATGQIFALRLGRIIFNGGSVISATTPTTAFNVGSASGGNGCQLEINGFDFSNWANTFDLFNDDARQVFIRARNCKFASGWGVKGSTGEPTTADFNLGNSVELINWGTGDTHNQFWIENRGGYAMENTAASTYPVVKTVGGTDGNAAWSIKLTTLTNVAYPSTIYRGPPIRRRVTAQGPVSPSVSFVYNGGTPLTDKQVWMEWEYLGASGFPLSTVYSSCPSFITNAGSYTASGEAWDGDSGAGPNDSGSTTWNQAQFFASGITIAEDGYIIATPCMAVASTTIFVNPQIDGVT